MLPNSSTPVYAAFDSIVARVVRLSLVMVALFSVMAPTVASPAQAVVVSASSKSADQSSSKKPSKKDQELSSSLQGLTGTPFNNDMVDGAGFIDKMIAAAESSKDYSFDYTMKVFKDRKTIVEQGVFYFKQKPRMIRLEETGSYKKGSVAILGANGKVKAHMGGGMKMFVVELDPDSNMLKSANGFPMTDSDFSSLSQALKSYLKKGVTAQVTREAFDMKAEHDRVFVLELRKNKDTSKIWKRVAVSSRTHLPVQWWDYDDDGELWSHANWDGFKPNQQLADSLFNIKNDSDSNG
jgi:outer membrane lipoprotein-sorting protein